MIALYLDEDLSRRQLIGALRSRGFDVLTSLEAGMNGRNDGEQLSFASAQGRVLLTSNARDFVHMHAVWMAESRAHAGILIVPQQRYSIGEILRRLLRFSASGAKTSSRLYYLSNASL